MSWDAKVGAWRKVCGCIRREWCSKYVSKEWLKAKIKRQFMAGVSADIQYVRSGRRCSATTVSLPGPAALS